MTFQLSILLRALGVLALLLASACGDAAPPPALPQEPAAEALDSLRREVARLGATLDAVSESVDRVRDAVGEPDGVSLAEAGETARSYGLRAALALLILTFTAIVIGLAARDILRSIFGGLVILFERPFRVGDRIGVGGSYGEVVSIGLRSTRIVTPDDNLVTVPNAQIVDGQVSNANTGALDCQVITDLYLPGWVDEALARRVAHQVAASSKYVHLQKPIVVLVRDEFRETFLTHLEVKAYVIDARHEFRFMSDVTERARAEFRRLGLIGPQHGTRATVDLSPWGRAGVADAPAPETTGT